jgi:hypothetical protein
MGAAQARGDVLTFLDSHCECTHGWLEPQLQRIKDDRFVRSGMKKGWRAFACRRNVVCPVIDVINDRTFAYNKGIELFRGGFNWNLQFRWYGVPPKLIKVIVFVSLIYFNKFRAAPKNRPSRSRRQPWPAVCSRSNAPTLKS